LTVDATGVLTLEAGVRLEFSVNTSDDFLVQGTLNAVGTAGNPVVITRRGGSYDWDGLTFASGSQGALDHTVIEYNGDDGHGVLIQSSDVQITNSTIRYNTTHGIQVSGGATPTISSSTITDNNGHGVAISDGSPVLSGNTIANNTSYAVFTPASRLSASLFDA